MKISEAKLQESLKAFFIDKRLQKQRMTEACQVNKQIGVTFINTPKEYGAN